MPRLTLALLALILPAAAQAACRGETLLSCPVGGADVLEVCIEPGAFTYAFGPSGAPELRLTAPMADAPVMPWSGVGRAIWSSVTFRNQGYAYEVWISLDRLTEAPSAEAGVSVLQGEDRIAQRTCLPGSVSADPFRLSDAMYEAGYCWDHNVFAWRVAGACG